MFYSTTAAFPRVMGRRGEAPSLHRGPTPNHPNSHLLTGLGFSSPQTPLSRGAFSFLLFFCLGGVCEWLQRCRPCSNFVRTFSAKGSRFMLGQPLSRDANARSNGLGRVQNLPHPQACALCLGYPLPGGAVSLAQRTNVGSANDSFRPSKINCAA